MYSESSDKGELMKPVLKKATKEITNLHDHVTHILICPKHLEMWVEEYLYNNEHPDTIDWCGCCRGDCVDDDDDTCKSCGQGN